MGSRQLPPDLAGEFSMAACPIAYHSGRWVPSNALVLPVTDPSITQGITAVERLRAYHGKLFQLERHLERWERTLDALFISGVPGREELKQLFTELLQRNCGWIRKQDQYGVVMLASPGTGNQTTFVIDLYPISPAMVSDRIEKGSPVVITSVQQPANECWPRNIKVRCRLHYYLADRMACQVHPDAIGILIDDDGTVTESSIANLVIVENGRVISPQRTQILDGVSLQIARELSRPLGIPWHEQRLIPERIRSADEIILTGTSCGIWFANSIDQRYPRSAGPIYRRLRSALEHFVDQSCAIQE